MGDYRHHAILAAEDEDVENLREAWTRLIRYDHFYTDETGRMVAIARESPVAKVALAPTDEAFRQWHTGLVCTPVCCCNPAVVKCCRCGYRSRTTDA